MKITVYTINDCKFSQAEKEYLKKNNVEFEEKNLETNRDFLTEMLAVSNNFAGTPVTQIEKDNGEKIVLKGFTVEEFDKALGLSTIQTSVAPQPTVQPVQEASQNPQEQSQPVPVVVEALSQDETTDISMPPTQPEVAPVPVMTPEPPAMSNEMIQPVSPPTIVPQQPEMNEPMMPPVSPVSQDTIEPISLDVTEPSAQQSQDSMPQVHVMPPVQPMPNETMQTVTPTSFVPPQQSAQGPSQQPQQTQADPLNSVLQNLQTQVDQASPKKEENQIQQ